MVSKGDHDVQLGSDDIGKEVLIVGKQGNYIKQDNYDNYMAYLQSLLSLPTSITLFTYHLYLAYHHCLSYIPSLPSFLTHHHYLEQGNDGKMVGKQGIYC